MRAHLTLLAAVFTLGTAAALARGDEFDDLRSRAAARDAQVQKLKVAGSVGETYLGYLEVPPSAAPDEAGRRLVSEENADRRRLYQLIAARDGGTPEAVADRAARRNFARTMPGHWLKFPNGTWDRKR